VPKAICETCGREYFGWSLISTPGQKCGCGGTLRIIDKKKAA